MAQVPDVNEASMVIPNGDHSVPSNPEGNATVGANASNQQNVPSGNASTSNSPALDDAHTVPATRCLPGAKKKKKKTKKKKPHFLFRQAVDKLPGSGEEKLTKAESAGDSKEEEASLNKPKLQRSKLIPHESLQSRQSRQAPKTSEKTSTNNTGENLSTISDIAVHGNLAQDKPKLQRTRLIPLESAQSKSATQPEPAKENESQPALANKSFPANILSAFAAPTEPSDKPQQPGSSRKARRRRRQRSYKRNSTYMLNQADDVSKQIISGIDEVSDLKEADNDSKTTPDKTTESISSMPLTAQNIETKNFEDITLKLLPDPLKTTTKLKPELVSDSTASPTILEETPGTDPGDHPPMQESTVR